jgi:hypothetical protein
VKSFMKSYQFWLILIAVVVVSLAAILRDEPHPAPEVVIGSGGPGTAVTPGIHVGQENPR